MTAIGGIGAPHVGGSDEEHAAAWPGRPHNETQCLLTRPSHGCIDHGPCWHDGRTIQAARPVFHVQREMRHRQLVFKSLAEDDPARYVVDDYELHRLAQVRRPRNDLNFLLLARHPTGFQRAQHGEHVWIGAGREPLVLLVPFGPPKPLVARAVREDRYLQIRRAHAGPEMQLRRPSGPCAASPVLRGRRSARKHRSDGEIRGPVVEQRFPVDKVRRGNRSIGKVQRVACERACVQGHGLVELHGKTPDQLELIRRNRRTGLVADAAEMKRTLMFEARDHHGLRSRSAHRRLVSAVPALHLDCAVGKQEQDARKLGAQQWIHAQRLAPKRVLQEVRSRLWRLGSRGRSAKQQHSGKASQHGDQPITRLVPAANTRLGGVNQRQLAAHDRAAKQWINAASDAASFPERFRFPADPRRAHDADWPSPWCR